MEVGGDVVWCGGRWRCSVVYGLCWDYLTVNVCIACSKIMHT